MCFGHIRSEGPNYLKRKKGMFVAWLDDGSESDSKEDTAKQVSSLKGIYDRESDCEDLNFEERVASYKDLRLRNKEVCQQREKQKRIMDQLHAERT